MGKGNEDRCEDVEEGDVAEGDEEDEEEAVPDAHGLELRKEVYPVVATCAGKA